MHDLFIIFCEHPAEVYFLFVTLLHHHNNTNKKSVQSSQKFEKTINIDAAGVEGGPIVQLRARRGTEDIVY